MVADNLVQKLESTNSALEKVCNARWIVAGPEATANPYLQFLLRVLPGVDNLLVMDGTGRVIAANREALLTNDLSDRNYFKTVRASPNPDTLYVSEPLTH